MAALLVANYIEKRPQNGNPDEDPDAMGQACLEYESKHPLQYRLMFSTPLPDPEQHPNMIQNARHAFALL